MDADTIITQLSETDGFPRDALQAASEQRAELVQRFIAEIENYLNAAPGERPSADALFFIFHLLGEWRESSAYPALARLLRLPTGEIDSILGDGVTSTSHRIMASVFDGDMQPLCDIIRDPDADEFIRSSMFEALAMLVHSGQCSTDAAASFFRECYSELQPQSANFVWFGWQFAIGLLGMDELTPLVKEAYERALIDASWSRFEHYLTDIEQAQSDPDAPFETNHGHYDLFGNTIEELSEWSGFQEKKPEPGSKPGPLFDWISASEPAVNPNRTVGRNDPCPCGSGKKFKKCCLQ